EHIAQAEEKKVLADPKYRTPARTLRRLSKSHVVNETPAAQCGAWDGFAMRHIGFALQRRMARDFGGDAEKMCAASTGWLGSVLGVHPAGLDATRRKAFQDFAMVLGLVPDLGRWTKEEKAGLLAIITAKAGRTEQRYQRLLLKHGRLRQVILGFRKAQ
ncbi:MAG TPA: hypothetical protein VEW69_06525, partial [Alphaproteobacteria bacterium]|nr:hypothetical protein [Alphaproteobacteria bacterium]